MAKKNSKKAGDSAAPNAFDELSADTFQPADEVSDGEVDHATEDPETKKVARWRRDLVDARVEGEIPREIEDAIATRLAELSAEGSPLTAEDALALAILELRVTLTLRFTETNQTVTRARELEFETVAVGTVATLYMPAFIALGIVPFGVTQQETEAAVERWWVRWLATLDVGADSSPAERERKAAIDRFFDVVIRPLITDTDALLRSVRNGVRMSHRSRGLKTDAKKLSSAEAASEFSMLTLSQPGPFGLYFKNVEGQLQLSERELRDRLGRSKSGVDLLVAAEELIGEVSAKSDGARIVDIHDDLVALDLVAQAARANAQPGSADQVVLEHLSELACEEVSAAALATRYGLNERTVQVAWKRWRERLRSDPRLKGLADPE